MAIRFPNPRTKQSHASAPKAWVGLVPKTANLRAFSALTGGQCCPPHCPPQPGPILREPEAFSGPPGGTPKAPLPLGPPMNIRAVAWLIGCSPWTVRQTLIPKGLPVFRSGANGRLIFYQDQVIRWIETQIARRNQNK